MTLLDICMRVAYLKGKIDENTKELRALRGLMQIDKYMNSSTLKEKYTKLFDETSELMNEYDFYTNEFDHMQKYFDVKVY